MFFDRPKFDGVIEAVHYAPDGQVAWVRAYERRGPTFSDCVVINRDGLINRLKAKKRFVIGRRIPQLASTFDTSVPVRLIRENNKEILVTGHIRYDQDHMEGVFVI